MNSISEQVSGCFAKDVASHVMTIHRDEGVDRRVTFRRPETRCMSFELVTWPGVLAYTGDMGSFMFTRLHDMFEFFRLPEYPARLPDFRYWEEKCIAADRHGGTRQFNVELFEQNVKAWLVGFTRDLPRKQRMDVWRQANDELLGRTFDHDIDAYRAAMDFTWNGRAPLQDFWEVSCDEHTYHFTWACHAIAWGIQQFDAAQAAREAAA